MTPSLRTSRLREITIITSITIGLVSLFYHLRGIAFIGSTLTLITAAILLYIPMVLYWVKKERFGFIDHSLSDIRRSLVSFLYLSFLIFPLSFLGNHIYQTWIGSLEYRGSPHATVLVSFFLRHLLFIAFPEEFFYRGYLQDRINAFFSRPWRVLGCACGPGWLLTSFLFAISHSLIVVRWWHIFIFFPGLAFGWLKERTGTILAPILFHAACNTFAYWVFLSYS